MFFVQLTEVFTTSVPGFRQVTVEAFTPGSIVVQYAVVLDMSSTATSDTIIEAVQESTNDAGFFGDSSLRLNPTLSATGKIITMEMVDILKPHSRNPLLCHLG